MKIFNNTNVSKEFQKSAIAIGNFDGIHVGHQKVFRFTKKIAKKHKIKFGILTFTPLPIMFFNKKIKNFRLSSEESKMDILKKNHVDFVVNIKFNNKFSQTSPQNFIKKIIYQKIKSKFLAVSNNFKFGKNRAGDVTLLKKFSSKFNYRLVNIKPFKSYEKVVSSTKIRQYLKNGEINLANKLLSRTWCIEGRVIKGKKIGRKLGYRTCNIKIKKYILPRAGIYAVKVLIDNESFFYNGISYLGSRPTFGGKDVILETNIFNLDRNLYKKKLKIYFLKFLRKDQKFKNSQQLIKQMNKDVISAKKGLKTQLVL